MYYILDFSEALEKLVRVEKNKGEDKYVYVSCQSRYPVGTQNLMSNDSFDPMLQCSDEGLLLAVS